MPTLKALVAVLGLRGRAKNRALNKIIKRWSGIWVLLLTLDLIRFMRRRQSRVIERRILKDGEVLVISSSVNRERQ